MNTDINASDRKIYEEELREFLPPRIFDVHVHLFDAACIPPGYDLDPKSPYARFGGAFTLEQYLAWTAEWLPGHEMHLNSFGRPDPGIDRDLSAAYTGKISDNRRIFGFALVAPNDPVDVVERRVRDNGLAGYKPYWRLVPGKAEADITIEDMLPDAQMELADRLGLAVMLHIPRPGRLADPVNQAGMVRICNRFPNTKIIFAHIGRAYYLSNVIGFLDGIAACPNAFIDTSMVNHEGVLEYAFRNFPPDRILFGSDAPIACLRGKSVEVNNQYAYLMGEDYAVGSSLHDPSSKLRFTSFFYEQLRGIKLAAQRAGLDRGQVAGILFDNAHGLLTAVAGEGASGNGNNQR